ncbi:MAG: N-acetylneuraminate synthase [Nostoc sp.]|uniref:N-acetylneuraminate synthase n=1 Tax=Nostoc sp. TaxID=1180 RepID=UPI002FF99ACF
MKRIDIPGIQIGHEYPCFIIAEAGVNHNGSLDMAKHLIDRALEAGADAVKFQSFKSEKVVSSTAPKAEYQLLTTNPDESQLDMIRTLELSVEAHRELQSYSQKQGILFISTPFDEESADILEELKVPLFKIPSGEITNWPFLQYVARKGKPLIVSTGMSYLSEVEEALRVIRQVGCEQLVLLHCVSSYPTNPAEANLRAMHSMATALQVPVGYSDHTTGIEVALAAVALGACVIEKHFTLDKNLPGPDHKASLDPKELQALVKGVRKVECALGNGFKQPTASEINTRAIARRSLALTCDVIEGTVLEPQMLTALRPASGISPTLQELVLGRKVTRSLQAGQLISWSDFT